jgi:hypothetical protein
LNINTLYRICRLGFALLLLQLFACTSRKDAELMVFVKAKCVYKSSSVAKFESNTYQYSEIVVRKDVKKYEVGKYYYLEFRKK